MAVPVAGRRRRPRGVAVNTRIRGPPAAVASRIRASSSTLDADLTTDHRQFDATLTVRVPLGATGSLVDGAVCVVERIDAVETVANVAVRRVSPGLNDTTVDLDVRASLAADVDAGRARRTIEGGVGVLAVERVTAADPDAPPPAEAK